MSPFSTSDTIVAVSTPPGRSGIGVVRLSGVDACAVASRLLTRRKPLEPRRATFTRVRAAAGEPPTSQSPPGAPEDLTRPIEFPVAKGCSAIDTVVVTWFPGPGSYTGEDVVEISAHGSPVLLDRILGSAVDAGARLARPGEFTLRAFVNGRLDLVQAEAVADLIDAATPRQAALAFDQLNGTLSGAIEEIDAAVLDVAAHLEASVDFPDEGYRFLEAGEAAGRLSDIRARIGALLARSDQGQVIREGRTVAIAGRVNVGKSSIFNWLIGFDRAIVSAAPGTTRDMVAERLDIEGIPVTLVDTAGRRPTDEEVEREGVARAERAARAADATIVVLDGSREVDRADRELVIEVAARPLVVVVNKSDLRAAWDVSSVAAPWKQPVVCVSARTGEGMAALRKAIGEAVGNVSELRESIAVTNRRHVGCLREADASIARAEASAREGSPEEFVLADLQSARAALEELRGRRTPEDVLRHIFERFCIGK